MLDEKFYCIKMPSSKLLEASASFADDCFGGLRSPRMVIRSQANNVEVALVPNQSVATLDPYLEKLEYLKQNPFIEIKSLTVLEQQQRAQDLINVTITLTPIQDGPLGQEISVKIPQNNSELKTQILNSLHKNFNLVTLSELNAKAMTAYQRKQVKIHESNITSLEKTAEQLITGLAEQSSKWDESVRLKHETLESKYSERETALQEKIDAAESKLLEEQEAFELEKNEFNDKARTHERRDLLEKLKEVINTNKKFSLSENTKRKRLPINIICTLILYISGASIGYVIYKFLSGTTENYTVLMPLPLVSILFASTLVYYLRWQNRWFNDHAKAEFENKRFERDMLRASWLTEMYFEWQEEKHKEFPQELIGSFTKNLFESENEVQGVNHPLEDILKTASNVKKFRIGKDAFEVETKE